MRKRLVVAWVLLLLLQACQPAVSPPTVTSPTPIKTQEIPFPPVNENPQLTPATPFTPTHTPLPPALTPTITRTPARTIPTPTVSACMQAGGRVEVDEITTALLPSALAYRIYLPPCYDEEPERSYPVLYLIHGQSSTDAQWDKMGAPKTADRLVATGEAAPFIIVMPRDRVWSEPSVDNFGQAVEQSLIPWVDEHYRTLPDRDHRAIGGLSRGGAWAIHLGFSFPELFGAVGAHSGFVFHSDVQPLRQWLDSIPEGMAPRIYLDIADNDRPEIAISAAWLEDLLTRYNFAHEWHMYIGEHNEAYWQAHLEEYLRWYSMDWDK